MSREHRRTFRPKCEQLDGRYLLASEGRTRIEVAKHSRVDGERYDAFERELDAVANLLREFVLQAPPNLTRGVGGTGLGLYISRELVTRMNGRIWVVSDGRNGSSFFLELPIA